MTPPPTDEFENLRLLRDAAEEKCGDDREAWPAWYAFTTAALAALGPEGCVTRELELLKAARDGFKKDFADAMDWMREARAERDALKDEVKRLTQHTKDAHKENAILLARLVKLSAAERELWTSKATDVDSAGDRYVMDSALQKLHRVVEEIPPR